MIDIKKLTRNSYTLNENDINSSVEMGVPYGKVFNLHDLIPYSKNVMITMRKRKKIKYYCVVQIKDNLIGYSCLLHLSKGKFTKYIINNHFSKQQYLRGRLLVPKVNSLNPIPSLSKFFSDVEVKESYPIVGCTKYMVCANDKQI